MSKFAKALEQAQRDRALRTQGAPPPPIPVVPPVTAAPRAPSAPPPIPVVPPGAAAPRKIAAPPRRPAHLTGDVDSHLVSLVAPAGLEAEQYRALRHMVEQRKRAENVSVIAVSGPGVGDGKTTTAINLAGALAQAQDASVLLVEADLRKPSIGRLLGFSDSGGVGLVDAILNPQLSLADIVQPRPPFNLGVVLASQTLPSPYEVLKAPRLGALLDQAREQYDYVVLDTPPLVAVQDCRVVARWVDSIVVVVAADHTPRALLDAAFDSLDPAKVMGIVFNGFDHLVSGRYASHYPSYYTSDLTTPARKAGRLRRVTRSVGSLLRRGDGATKRKPRDRDRAR